MVQDRLCEEGKSLKRVKARALFLCRHLHGRSSDDNSLSSNAVFVRQMPASTMPIPRSATTPNFFFHGACKSFTMKHGNNESARAVIVLIAK